MYGCVGAVQHHLGGGPSVLVVVAADEQAEEVPVSEWVEGWVGGRVGVREHEGEDGRRWKRCEEGREVSCIVTADDRYISVLHRLPYAPMPCRT